METMMVHCTGCRAVLRVPANTSGRAARCPACKTKFIVPDAQELLEETVSSWLEQDTETVHRLDEQGAFKGPMDGGGDETIFAAAVDPRSPTSPPKPEHSVVPRQHPSQPPKRPLEPGTASQPGTILDKHSDKVYWKRKGAGSTPEQTPGAGDTGAGAPIAPAHFEPDKPLPIERVVAPPATSASRSGTVSVPPTVDSPGMAKLGPTPLTYPTNLQRDPVAPHLVVLRTSHAGVTLAFDAIWLGHEAFRGSMPVRCAFSGKSKRDELIARPIVFEDRALTDKRTLEQAVAPLEHRHLADRTARQLAATMAEVPHMPPPFQLPMPYFVSTRYAHLSLHCLTRNRTDGGVTCEVLVPDPHSALHWLSNVNGMCGPEYELLEREVLLLHGEVWRALSDTCRERLAYWCKLEPGEQFRLFVSDADFGKRDEGMGGLVVTDHRLVFCKYHHRGQVRLDEQATIRIKSAGGFATLVLVSGTDRVRMVKVNDHDLPRVLDVVQQAPGLRYEIVQDEAHHDDSVGAPSA